ncbi:MAG TPA: hypothetical protein VEX35_10850 [Allosphingosinicella sp.]|nr:hypothetical protein [Allosphingosinicella sp.]
MKRVLIPAPSILALAACSRGPASFQPGQWEMAMAVTAVDAPGLPPETLARLRAAVGRPQTTGDCMTADQAASPVRDLRAGMRQGMGSMGGPSRRHFRAMSVAGCLASRIGTQVSKQTARIQRSN